MSQPTPSIRVQVDPTNPGQFFACCGLLELADRLWPGAEGWFEGKTFLVDCGGTLPELLRELAKSRIESSLTDQGLERLGSLLSQKKSTLTPDDEEEKARLSEQWKRERLHLAEPFDLWVDWWSDEQTGGKQMKTWAAKQLVLHMARPMLDVLRTEEWHHTAGEDVLTRTAPVDGVPFYFDAHNNWQSTPRDTGFGLYTLRDDIETRGSTRPLLELAAFLGIQRFRPAILADRHLLAFSLWPKGLPITVAAIAAAGLLNLPGERRYAFRMLFRSEYMKAFLPAEPYSGA